MRCFKLYFGDKLKSEHYLFRTIEQFDGGYRNFNFLPGLNSIEKSLLMEELVAIVKSYSSCNSANEVFVTSPFACFNHWQSGFFSRYAKLKSLIKLLAKRQSFVLYLDDFESTLLVLDYAKAHAVDCRASLGTLVKIYFLKIYRYLREVLQFFLSLRALMLLVMPMRSSCKRIPVGIDTLFVSTWFDKTVANFHSDMKDPFFGTLYHDYKIQGSSAALFCHIEQYSSVYVSQFETLKRNDIYSYFNILPLGDIFKVLTCVVSASIKSSESFIEFHGAIIRELRYTKWVQSLHALLVKYVLIRIILSNPQLNNVVHTFEGNCWERGIILAKRKMQHHFNIIGYQHTAFPMSFRKLSFNPYSPEKIFCTGNIPAQLFIEKFGHGRENVLVFGVLRNLIDPAIKLKQSFPACANRILVLLQGGPEDSLFVYHVVRLLEDEDVVISIRPHPGCPIDSALLPHSVRLCNEVDLYEALDGNDLVFYSGTTAALLALYAGLPIAYVGMDDCESANLMCELVSNPLVNIINSKQDLASLFVQFKTANFTLALEEVRHYCDQYFLPIAGQMEIKLKKLLDECI